VCTAVLFFPGEGDEGTRTILRIMILSPTIQASGNPMLLNAPSF